MTERIKIWPALRRSWRLLLVLVIVGAIIAIAIPVSAKPNPNHKYHWRTAATVGVEPAGGIGVAGVSGQTVLFFANNYYVKLSAVTSAGMAGDYQTLVSLMSAKSTPSAGGSKRSSSKGSQSSNLIQLATDQTTQDLSAKLTNAYALAVGNAVNEAYARHVAATARSSSASSNGNGSDSGYTILVPALASEATRTNGSSAGPLSSHKVRLLAGLVLGLLVGVAIVFVREMTDRTVRSSSGAESASRYPVLVEIPPVRTVGGMDPAGVLSVAESPTSTSAEGYRMLRMSVMFEELASTQAPPDPYGLSAGPWEAAPTNGKYTKPEPESRKVVLVISSADEETRPIVAANLGATYAESGQKAIVVSTDDIDTGYGLGRQAQMGPIGPEDVATALQPSSLPNVARLSMRHFVVNSGQLVTRAPEVLDAARGLADVVVVESPPFLESHHGEALLHAVDVVLVVVECRHTRIDRAGKTGDLLRRLGAPVLGVVLTNVGGPRPRSARSDEPARAPEPEPAPAPSSVGDPQAIPEVAKR